MADLAQKPSELSAASKTTSTVKVRLSRRGSRTWKTEDTFSRLSGSVTRRLYGSSSGVSRGSSVSNGSGEKTPAEFLTKLYLASESGLENIIDAAILEGADINTQDEEGRSALIWAAKSNRAFAAQALIERRALIDLPTRHGATALGIAAWRGFKDMVQLLLEARGDIDGGACTTSRAMCASNVPAVSKPPINWAIEGGQVEVADMLLKAKADVRCRSEEVESPLMLCARKGHCDIAELLFLRSDQVDWTESGAALGLSAQRGHGCVLKMLLERKADARYQDDCGVTALMWAASLGHTEVANLIIATSKEAIDQECDDGRTPLMLAAERSHLDITRSLLASGASLYKPLEILEATSDFPRLGGIIAMGISTFSGVEQEAFARKFNPKIAAGIIRQGGETARSFVDGLFVPQEVVHPGLHHLSAIRYAYMRGLVHTCVDAAQVREAQPAVLREGAEERLCPQYRQWNHMASHEVEVQIVRCVLPKAWDPWVVDAIAHSPGDEIFDGIGSIAIVSHAWSNIRFFHLLITVSLALTISLLFYVAALISDYGMEASIYEITPLPVRYILNSLWILRVTDMALVTAAGVCKGCFRPSELLLTLPYFLAVINVLLVLAIPSFGGDDTYTFRHIATLVVLAEWWFLMKKLAVHRFVGSQFLPIIASMETLRSMSIVLGIALCTAVHGYLMLSRQPLLESMFTVWELGLLAAVSADNFEADIAPDLVPAMRALYIVLAFGLTLVLMNIFIAVVGNVYSEFAAHVEALLWRQRANMCVQYMLSPYCQLLAWLFRLPIMPESDDQRLWVCVNTSHKRWCNESAAELSAADRASLEEIRAKLDLLLKQGHVDVN